MKTYLLSNLDRLAKYSKTLDVKAILYNKNWEVFNENHEKEVLIFRPKGELLIVRKGIVSSSSWELLPTGAILITSDSTTYMFNAAFVDENVLALQLDGTKECMVMVDKEAVIKLMLDSLKKIELYLERKYKETEPVKEETCNTSNTIPKDPYRPIAFIVIIISISTIIIALLTQL